MQVWEVSFSAEDMQGMDDGAGDMGESDFGDDGGFDIDIGF